MKESKELSHDPDIAAAALERIRLILKKRFDESGITIRTLGKESGLGFGYAHSLLSAKFPLRLKLVAALASALGLNTVDVVMEACASNKKDNEEFVTGVALGLNQILGINIGLYQELLAPMENPAPATNVMPKVRPRGRNVTKKVNRNEKRTNE